MIRSPLEVCRERKWETAAVSFAVVVVLGIPLGFTLFALAAYDAAEQWLESYTPIVYLAPDTSEEAANKLAQEIAEWPLVAAATVRTAEEAHGALEERLGVDSIQHLGVTAGMLPTSIVLSPAVPVAGHIDLVARASALEARMEVDAVEVPSSSAMRVVHFAALGGVVAALLALLGIGAAAVLLLSFFERLRNVDDETDRVLALFGAHPSELRRPSLLRGLAVGTACGVAVSCAACFGLLVWQLYAPHVVGVDVSLPVVAWSVAAAPLVLVPVIGFVTAWRASSRPVTIWRRAHA